ncbi:hypothetical protein [Luteibacter aegosomatissinici]|uniref:hypothetical protein n=1 Tax=Luteibacter aegosomatissinici TaxID=2911539 RepID=UPI001FF8DA47|nr:hypothetical protein [Luteibacter aegosomatissinici]UPG96141.1 hypothetical protein L2Y97_08540 [Luteibacter aegosomatissinici]
MAILFVTGFDECSKAVDHPKDVSHGGRDMRKSRMFNQAEARPPKNTSIGGAALAQGDAVPSPLLLQMNEAIVRIETELAHLTKVAEATRKDVDDLKTWKTLVLGGATVIGLLFALYKALAGTIHVGFGVS